MTHTKQMFRKSISTSLYRNCMFAYLACELLLLISFHFLQKQENKLLSEF